MSKHEIVDEETEWAILYGDGEAEPFDSPFAAAGRITELREQFSAGGVMPSDYEPMKVVRRKVKTVASKWKAWH